MKHKPIKFLGVLGVITTATLMGAGEASAIVAVDTFEDDHSFRDNTANSSPEIRIINAASSNSIIGDQREVFLDADQIDAGEGPRTVAGNENEELSLNEGTSQNGELTLRYDGSDSDSNVFDSSSGLNNVDVTESDANKGFLFELSSQSSDTTNLTVNLFSGGDSVSASVSSSTLTGNVFFAFEEEYTGTKNSFFEATGVDTFAFTSVTGIELIISTNDSGDDIAFDAVGFAPDINSEIEPVPFEAETSIALALLGSWGAWKYWRKRRTQANDVNSVS